MAEILVIGIGDPLRSDDGAGPAVIERLRCRRLSGVQLENHWGEGTALMALWRGHHRVVLVDAMVSDAAPGTLRWFSRKAPPPSGIFPYSTHRFGLAEAVRLSAVLGELPGELWVLGIEGSCFAPGNTLSPPVAEAVVKAADEIAELCIHAASVGEHAVAFGKDEVKEGTGHQ